MRGCGRARSTSATWGTSWGEGSTAACSAPVRWAGRASSRWIAASRGGRRRRRGGDHRTDARPARAARPADGRLRMGRTAGAPGRSLLAQHELEDLVDVELPGDRPRRGRRAVHGELVPRPPRSSRPSCRRRWRGARRRARTGARPRDCAPAGLLGRPADLTAANLARFLRTSSPAGAPPRQPTGPRSTPSCAGGPSASTGRPRRFTRRWSRASLDRRPSTAACFARRRTADDPLADARDVAIVLVLGDGGPRLRGVHQARAADFLQGRMAQAPARHPSWRERSPLTQHRSDSGHRARGCCERERLGPTPAPPSCS